MPEQVYDLPIEEQKSQIGNKLIKHQQTHERRDDITVKGIQI